MSFKTLVEPDFKTSFLDKQFLFALFFALFLNLFLVFLLENISPSRQKKPAFQPVRVTFLPLPKPKEVLIEIPEKKQEAKQSNTEKKLPEKEKKPKKAPKKKVLEKPAPTDEYIPKAKFFKIKKPVETPPRIQKTEPALPKKVKPVPALMPESKASPVYEEHIPVETPLPDRKIETDNLIKQKKLPKNQPENPIEAIQPDLAPVVEENPPLKVMKPLLLPKTQESFTQTPITPVIPEDHKTLEPEIQNPQENTLPDTNPQPENIATREKITIEENSPLLYQEEGQNNQKIASKDKISETLSDESPDILASPKTPDTNMEKHNAVKPKQNGLHTLLKKPKAYISHSSPVRTSSGIGSQKKNKQAGYYIKGNFGKQKLSGMAGILSDLNCQDPKERSKECIQLVSTLPEKNQEGYSLRIKREASDSLDSRYQGLKGKALNKALNIPDTNNNTLLLQGPLLDSMRGVNDPKPAYFPHKQVRENNSAE